MNAAELLPGILISLSGAAAILLRRRPGRRTLLFCLLLALATGAALLYRMQIPRLPSLTRWIMTAFSLP